MDTLTGQKKIFQLYDKSLSRIETPQGTLTLVSVFLPFFVEMEDISAWKKEKELSLIHI